MNPGEQSRCWAEIDLTALRRNAAVARERVGEKVELMAVVKANGYGHGMIEVAKALAGEADLFGVANLQEAIELEPVVSRPIVILGPALPEERQAIAEHDFVPSVSSVEEAEAFGRVSADIVPVNLVVDTGMGRMGFNENDVLEAIRTIASLPKIDIHSISTHLPVADEDAAFTRAELARFSELIGRARAIVKTVRSHALLSAGILGFAERPFDIVRAGLMLYGVSPLPEYQSILEPVMSLKTRVVLVRDVAAGASISYGRTFIAPQAMRVATLAAGYADGYPRSLSGKGASILIRGRRCALLGRVTMDLIMVDVTGVSEAAAGDEAVLLGKQEVDSISASEVANWAGTIPWEIFTGIGSRVRRVYLS